MEMTTHLELEMLNAENCYRDPHLEVDYRDGTLKLDSRLVVLTRKEYELLAMLARNAGEIIPREILLSRIWGYGKDIRTRTLDVHIRRLRKKLGVYGEQYIETIFGVGYRFQPYRESRPFQVFTAAAGLAVA
jgi:DNA-binding response OmpR family regulator